MRIPRILLRGINYRYLPSSRGHSLALLCIDPFLEDIAKGADRVFYFEEGPRETPRLTAKTSMKMKDQKTLEAFS
jgi:hypothetical protein